jgi:RNA polymerase sigma-70 factor (ECF subfamily)
MEDVTRLIERWQDGDADALHELTPLIYVELHRLAKSFMRNERSGHTLQPTALVNEAYMRLTGSATGRFNTRLHFYGAAAQVMRRILVDHARQHRSEKRNRGEVAATLDDAAMVGVNLELDLVAVDEALGKLALVAAAPAQVVELRYFGGLSIDETAEFLGISPATVKRHWSFARAWLHRALSSPPSEDGIG